MRKWIWKALDEVVNKKVYSNLYLRNHLQEVDEKDSCFGYTHFLWNHSELSLL